MLNGVNINYVIVLLVCGAVLLAALYHTILFVHRGTALLGSRHSRCRRRRRRLPRRRPSGEGAAGAGREPRRQAPALRCAPGAFLDRGL